MPLALTGWEIGLFSVAAVFIVLALIASMVVPRSRPEFPSRYLGWFVAGCIVLFAAQMTAVVLLAEVGEEEHEAVEQPEPGPGETQPEPTETTPTGPEPTTGETETQPPPPPSGGEGDPVAGKEVFTANCGSCHTLAEAGTTGTIGPNLDEAQPSFELVVDRVTNGKGVMPSFADTLSEQQIRDVAAYVSSATRG